MKTIQQIKDEFGLQLKLLSMDCKDNKFNELTAGGAGSVQMALGLVKMAGDLIEYQKELKKNDNNTIQ